MDFAFTPDQVAIRSAVDEICAGFPDEYWLKKDREGGFPEDFYSAIAKAGWLGIAMPTEYGGAGLGVTEAALMMQTVGNSAGYFAACSTIHINIFGLHSIVKHGTDKQDWLEATHDLGGLLGMRPGPDLEIHVRPRDTQLLKEER